MGLNGQKFKRIGIDARFYGPLGKGLGRYVQEVVDGVIKTDERNHYVIFLCAENFNDFKITSERVKKVLTAARWYSLSEQILMPYYIWREKLDLVHFPHFNVPVFCPVKFIVTIHDLILTKFPTTRATTWGPIMYKLKNLGYKITIWLAVKRAKKIIAVSRFTKNDIMENFKINPDKVTVTYEGIADFNKDKKENNNNDKETLLGYNIISPYLLYVGSAYPHKNLDGLIRAFRKIKEKIPQIKLVLVGKEDYFYNQIKKGAADLGLWKNNNPDSSVIFPGYIPDADLKIVYRNAIAYVFPSFYEGFGLPPLEAMANGCPVASSNKASMPEILGEAAAYFNPEDEDEMVAAIAKVALDERLREELRRKGYEQIKKFNWSDCAKKTLAIYDEIQ